MPSATQPPSCSRSRSSEYEREAAAAVDRHGVARSRRAASRAARPSSRAFRSQSAMSTAETAPCADARDGPRCAATAQHAPQCAARREALEPVDDRRSSVVDQRGDGASAVRVADARLAAGLAPRRPRSSSSPTRACRRTRRSSVGIVYAETRQALDGDVGAWSRRPRYDRPGSDSELLQLPPERLLRSRRRAPGRPSTIAFAIFSACSQRDVRRQRRHLGIDVDLEHDRAGRPRAPRPTRRRRASGSSTRIPLRPTSSA